MAYYKIKLSRRADGYYVRMLGKAYNGKGQLTPKRFLLGKDRRQAERANLLLEQLWETVVADFEQQRRAELALLDRGEELLRSPDDPTPIPRQEVADTPVHWTDQTLLIAEAARAGQVRVELPPVARELAHEYAERMADLARRFPDFTFAPPAEAEPLLKRGQGAHQREVEHIETQLQASAQAARVKIPAVAGFSLYQALEDYAARAPQQNKREAGRKEAEHALRLKHATPDMALTDLGYSALERIASYWASRPDARTPAGKTSGRPISVGTVDNHLKVARRFVRWLDRTDQYDWEMPRHGIDALTVNLRQLMTAGELSARAQGVEVFKPEQLRTIYQYATEAERLMLLLGLNGAFAQAELTTLRWTEVDHSTIKRIRHKSGVYGEFKLWPETQAALDAWAKKRGKSGELVMLTDKQTPYTRQQISNAWARLRRRIERETGVKADWWLSFKHLRKTAAQLVRQASDGEVAGVFLCHGKPVASDALADVYSNRPFDKVAKALEAVHRQLVDAGMFAGPAKKPRPRDLRKARALAGPRDGG